MNPGAELQFELGGALVILRRRLASSADAAERKALVRVIQRIDKGVHGLERAGLLDTATVLADAVDELESAVAAARHGPFDGYLAAMEGHLDALSRLSASVHARDALAGAPESGDEAPIARGREIGGPAGVLPTGLEPPSAVTDFPSLRDEYAEWYSHCELRPEHKGELGYYLKRLSQGQAAYEQVGQQLGIPWIFIGITHGMECGFNFKAHLHNGDPLSARTVQVPKGRPIAGNPPFTWSQSAADALVMKGYHQITDWSVPHMLYLFERYNGMGYRRLRVPTPYLWSYSNLYEKGKFVADGRFDPEAVSKQCGAALMLQAVQG